MDDAPIRITDIGELDTLRQELRQALAADAPASGMSASPQHANNETAEARSPTVYPASASGALDYWTAVVRRVLTDGKDKTEQPVLASVAGAAGESGERRQQGLTPSGAERDACVAAIRGQAEELLAETDAVLAFLHEALASLRAQDAADAKTMATVDQAVERACAAAEASVQARIEQVRTSMGERPPLVSPELQAAMARWSPQAGALCVAAGMCAHGQVETRDDLNLLSQLIEQGQTTLEQAAPSVDELRALLSRLESPAAAGDVSRAEARQTLRRFDDARALRRDADGWRATLTERMSAAPTLPPLAEAELTSQVMTAQTCRAWQQRRAVTRQLLVQRMDERHAGVRTAIANALSRYASVRQQAQANWAVMLTQCAGALTAQQAEQIRRLVGEAKTLVDARWRTFHRQQVELTTQAVARLGAGEDGGSLGRDEKEGGAAAPE